MRTLVLITLLLLSTLTATAQSLSVFDIDTSQFPVMKAKLYAFDANGGQRSVAASDISIREDGVSRTILSLTCPQIQPPARLSSVLVIDVSGSMSGGQGTTSNIDLAKAAASAWVQQLALGHSECAVASFDDKNYLNQDFTTDRDRLLTAIAALQPNGGTDYDQGLLLPPAGGLHVTANGKYRRVIVFLTDGTPIQPPQTAAIIAEARRQNCTIYTVTLGFASPQSLREISEQTGGKWFENISGVQQAAEVYREIQSQAQGGAPCEITWQSAVPCVGGERAVSLAWGTATTTARYSIPPHAVAHLEIVPRSLYFRAKPVGQRADTTVTITAGDVPFTVTDITSSNPSFTITPTNFTLNAGESRTLTISYLPPDSSYSWTRFDVQTDRCTRRYTSSGGYPGKGVHQTLKVDRPNGGEEWIAGSDTTIAWSGIPLEDRVRLEYSTDNGGNWIRIASHVSEGEYQWHVPKTPSMQCLVRARQRTSTGLSSPGSWVRPAGNAFIFNTLDLDEGDVAVDDNGSVYVAGQRGGAILVAKWDADGVPEWERTFPGGSRNEGRGIAVDDAGNVYVTGVFTGVDQSSGGTIDFGGVPITSSGGADMFVAKFRPDGSVEWATDVGGIWGDEGNSIAVDASGSVYVAASCSASVDFGGVVLPDAGDGDFLLVKYRTDGSIEWARRPGNGRGDAARGVAVDASGDVYVTGELNNTTAIARYRQDGTVVWTREKVMAGSDIAVDIAGNIYATGISLRPYPSQYFEGFVARYRPDGSHVWTARGGGLSITVDDAGNIYSTGRFAESVDLDGIMLTSAGGYDVIVTRYAPDGSIDWARSAGGGATDDGQGIAVGIDGNVYVQGEHGETADFGGHLLTGSGSFVWKLGDDTFQSDISDALFSIVLPSASSRNVDMGRMLVGAAKDSVVQTFITNTGSYPFDIQMIQIIGADASHFSIVSGFPIVTVQPGMSHPVEFGFRPVSAGLKSAQVRIITQSDTLLQTISGEGVTPTLAVVGDVVDFGTVEINRTKDTTLPVAIRNDGNAPVSFNSASMLGPDAAQFSIVAGGDPFSLDPNESHTITLHFAPELIGRTSGRLGFDYNGVGSPAVIHLFGQGLGGLVSIADDSAFVGEERQIALHLENVKTTSIQSVAATGFRARIAYDGTILHPRNGEISRGEHYDTVAITGTLGNDSVLARLPFVAMLGTGEVSPLDIVDFAWLDGSSQPVEYDVETRSGMFRVLGICEDGGTRLYNPSDRAGIVKITPNPIGDAAEIEITTIESGRTRLVVMDMLGREAATIFDGDLPTGGHRLILKTADLPTGSYYVTLTTETIRRAHRLDVVR